jgi:UDP-glucose 4-epimerase
MSCPMLGQQLHTQLRIQPNDQPLTCARDLDNMQGLCGPVNISMVKHTSKPVLVTGGAGFVGSHLVHHLVSLGCPTVVVDDLSTGRIENLPSEAAEFRFVQRDICEPDALRELVEQSSFVCHLAAAVGTRLVTGNPIDALRRNLDGVRLVARECARTCVPLLFVSSSAVYELPRSGREDAHRESTALHPFGIHPVSLYAETKLLGELICDTYQRTEGLRCLIVRPFNLVGVRQRDTYGMVVPTFIRCALAGRPLPVHGDGTQARTFSDAGQAVEMMWRLAQNENCYGRIVNLATNDTPWRILDLARLVECVVGRKAVCRFIPHAEALGPAYRDVRCRRPSLDLLRELLGSWDPVPLETTLREIRDHELARLDTSEPDVDHL